MENHFEKLWEIFLKESKYKDSDYKIFYSICQRFYVEGYKKSAEEYLNEMSKQFNKEHYIGC